MSPLRGLHGVPHFFGMIPTRTIVRRGHFRQFRPPFVFFLFIIFSYLLNVVVMPFTLELRRYQYTPYTNQMAGIYI